MLLKAMMLLFIPRSMIFWSDKNTKNTVAITFDDGPHEKYTAPILDILSKYNVKATFFVLGKNAEINPDIVRRMIGDGHELANHSYEHNKYVKGRLSRPVAEIRETNKVFEHLFNYKILLYRPPYGMLSIWSLMYCILKRMPTVLWTVDSRDYKRNGDTLSSVKWCTDSEEYNGDVFLFHDHNPFTAEILDGVLANLIARGVEFKTAGQLVCKN